MTREVGVLTPREPFELGSAVRRVLEDEPRRRRMAVAARRRAERRFDTVQLAKTLEAWLNELV